MDLTLTVLATLTLLTAAATIYIYFFYTDYPQIPGIPSIPNPSILSGHLHALGTDHATTTQKWATEYGWPVFQLRLGNRRAIILNSFESAREWMIKHQAATIDRPWFYTFHGIVSKTSAATIGTRPWDERTKKQRRVVGSFTTGPAIQRMRAMLDVETAAVIAGLGCQTKEGAIGDREVAPHLYLKRLALNIMMMFCYGTRFSSVTDPLLTRILDDAQTIASFRSTNSNPQDFIPHLRYFGTGDRTHTATKVRERRDKWLAAMLETVRKNTKHKQPPSDKRCVAEMLIENNQDGLTELDIKTILGGLMSGGFETVFSTAIITMGMLSSPEGQKIQENAYENILSVYQAPDEAFERCLTEEKCPYLVALVKEALRFYPPLKLLPARQVYNDFEYRGVTIPRGISVYVNAQAVNFDKSVYGPDADTFNPGRWMDSSLGIPPPYHFAFGAGARQCTAVNFSNRVLYAMFARLILSFRMTESKEMPCNTHHIAYKKDPAASNAIPKDFRVKLIVRDDLVLHRCLKRSQGSFSSVGLGMDTEDLLT
ncbi:cytochrome P450 [Aspergillus californicus]